MVNTSETFNYRKPQTFYMWGIRYQVIVIVCSVINSFIENIRAKYIEPEHVYFPI